jgi:hypothetical protein
MGKGGISTDCQYHSIIHAAFIILAAAGMVNIYHSMSKSRKDAQLARSQAEMVQFNERRARMARGPIIA